MALKKIIVPVNLSAEPQYILEYASKIAYASNYKLSCICYSGDPHSQTNRNHVRNENALKLDSVRVINRILSEKKIAYEVIITKKGLYRSLQNYSAINTLHLMIIELSDINHIYQLIESTETPFILFHHYALNYSEKTY
jgi:hypothetical protein